MKDSFAVTTQELTVPRHLITEVAWLAVMCTSLPLYAGFKKSQAQAGQPAWRLPLVACTVVGCSKL